MKTPHRLATILFADIQGYTALMEKNENEALSNLQVFQFYIEKIVTENDGNIQNFYGDGCLISFGGSTDAVNCAVQLQHIFWKEYKIPVRMGIHTGEVVFKDVNVYGNAVNTASRIESIGVPGSVLLSRAVANQVANNLDYQMVSLGKFEFKNLSAVIEVLAISDAGLQIPDKDHIKGKLKYPSKTNNKTPTYLKVIGITVICVLLIVLWRTNHTLNQIFGKNDHLLLSENGLYIPPFENQTGDSSLNNIGDYTAMVIASAIQSSGLAIVKDKPTLEIGPRLLESKLPNFGEPNLPSILSDIRFVLQGMYLKNGDTLSFLSKIVDLQDNNTLHIFPTADGHLNSYSEIINELKNDILGYWATKDLPLYDYNPPDYQSYREYLLAIKNWEGDPEIVLGHIKKAKKLDSTFYRAHLLELELYDNYYLSKIDSMLIELEEIKAKFSKNELNLYNSIKAKVRNLNKAAFRYYMEEFKNAPQNLYVNTTAMNIASVLVNHPGKAVEIGEYIDWKNVPYNDCDYCQDRLTVQARAYIDIGEEEKALEILRFAETGETDLLNRGIKELEIRALARMGNVEAIDELLQKAKHQTFNYNLTDLYFTFWAASEMILAGNRKEANRLAEIFYTALNAENRNKYLKNSARLYLYLGDYQKAESELKEILRQGKLGGWKYYYESLHAASLGFQGKTETIAPFLNILSEKAENDKYLKSRYLYYQAMIYASMKEEEKAIGLLKESIYAGKRFYRWEFQHDPIIKNQISVDKLDEVLSLLH